MLAESKGCTEQAEGKTVKYQLLHVTVTEMGVGIVTGISSLFGYDYVYILSKYFHHFLPLSVYIRRVNSSKLCIKVIKLQDVKVEG